jgi:DNA polymerase elongation subunit (family B)
VEAGGFCRLPTERGTRFRTDRRGVIPVALDMLVSKRDEYTAKKDAAERGSPEWHYFGRLSQAFKIVANSVGYGILGSPFTRFFCRELAEGVAQTGAWLIKHVGARSREANLDPFYGDTDAIFVEGEREAFAVVVKNVNAEWPGILRELGCTDSHIMLEFEKSFRRLVLVTKKRYAGALSVHKGEPVGIDKKPEVKGLEFKRGDAVRLARKMQKELITMLLAVELPPLEDFKAFVERWRQRVREEPLELDDIVISQSVKVLSEYALRYTARLCGGAAIGFARKRGAKCGYDFGGTAVAGTDATLDKCPRCKGARKIAAQPAHVRVAKVMQERGEEIREGTRVDYLIVVSEGKNLEAVPAHDDGALDRVDRAYYWDSRIYPACARVLEATHPTVVWVESAKQQKARELEETRATQRGAVDDLPLFAASGR